MGVDGADGADGVEGVDGVEKSDTEGTEEHGTEGTESDGSRLDGAISSGTSARVVVSMGLELLEGCRLQIGDTAD